MSLKLIALDMIGLLLSEIRWKSIKHTSTEGLLEYLFLLYYVCCWWQGTEMKVKLYKKILVDSL